MQPKKRKKFNCFDQVLQVFQRGGRGGEAAALEKEKKSQQFGHDFILDPF